MALGRAVGRRAGLTPTKIETDAAVTLAKTDSGFAVTRIALTATASVPGATKEVLRQGRCRRQGRLPHLQALRQQHRDYARRKAGVSGHGRWGTESVPSSSARQSYPDILFPTHERLRNRNRRLRQAARHVCRPASMTRHARKRSAGERLSVHVQALI